MKKLLIFGGTTEGRRLSEWADETGIPCEVHVATEYGEQVMPENAGVQVKVGRLDKQAMGRLFLCGDYLAVVDATHPFAVEVTKTIKAAIEGTGISYLRLRRDVGKCGSCEEEKERAKNVHEGAIAYYTDINACAKALEETEGNVLLTTGSKELCAFCTEELRTRLVARVLPGMESLKICYDNGLLGSQIIAMQGPFSKEMNLSVIHQYNIRHLVTKQSGRVGGVDEKLLAAKTAGIQVHMICPKEPDEGMDFGFVCEKIRELAGIHGMGEKTVSAGNEPASQEKEPASQDKIKVYLVGLGPGTDAMMTKEAAHIIKKADVIFGAPRLLDSIQNMDLQPERKEYPFYLADDILPKLTGIHEKESGEVTCVMLFSGDTGFYSGMKKLSEALCGLSFVEVKVLPGLSSIAVMAARMKTSWQDAFLYSTHGVLNEKWEQQFVEAFQYGKKSFFLTSGLKDVKRMQELIAESGGLKEEDRFYYGYQLSYPEEEVQKLEVCTEKRQILPEKDTGNHRNLPEKDTGNHRNLPEKEGLYVVYLHSSCDEKKKLTPGISDEAFIRDKVPMTKEEVRTLVLSKMKLRADSVVYDIGSGTGSVSVEIARMHPDITVYALERKKEAVELLKKNLLKFHLHNVVSIQTIAPEGIKELPVADIAFLGGTGGELEAVMAALYGKNPKMQVIFTAVTMESVVAMEEVLKKYPEAKAEVVQVQVSRVKPVGNYRMLTANNPVFLYNIFFE